MKALLSKTPGGPDSLVLEDVPSPTPGEGDVVILPAFGASLEEMQLLCKLRSMRSLILPGITA